MNIPVTPMIIRINSYGKIESTYQGKWPKNAEKWRMSESLLWLVCVLVVTCCDWYPALFNLFYNQRKRNWTKTTNQFRSFLFEDSRERKGSQAVQRNWSKETWFFFSQDRCWWPSKSTLSWLTDKVYVCADCRYGARDHIVISIYISYESVC